MAFCVRPSRFCAFLFLVLIGATGLRAQSARPQAIAVRDLMDLYETELGELNRYYDLEFSAARAARLERFHTEWLERIGIVEFDALDRAQKIDYILFRHHLEDANEKLAFAKERRTRILAALPFAEALTALEESRRRFERPDPEATARTLAALKKDIEAVKPKLERGLAAKDAAAEDAIILDRPDAVELANAVGGLRGALDRWWRNFGGYDPLLTWWCKKPYEAAVQALDEYAGFVRQKIAKSDGDALIGRPIGREALTASLAHELIPYTPEQLITLATDHMTWCEGEMRRAAQEMGMGDDWKKALDEVKKKSVMPGEQAALVAEIAKESIAFIDKNELMTIPPLARELWRTEMLSADGQRYLPFASYDGLWMAVAYPTDEMDADRKVAVMRGNNRHFTRLVAPHELIPGHHLQGHYAARSMPWRRMFSTPFLVEGWAVYGEMLFWELGFTKAPEDRIGALLWRMHRCARVIVSLGFHLGQMSPEQMIDYLVEHVGLERDGATGEVRRYIGGGYGPLYQCGYLIGALQFRALKRELIETGKMTYRAFHDRILEENSIPVEMIRAALEPEVPLTKDYRASWRFGGDLK